MENGLRFRVNEPGVVYEKIDEEVVIINLDSGNYYSIERIGVHIWSCIPSGAAEGEIIDEIAGRYSGSSEAIEAGVRGFLAQLRDEGLIVADEQGGTGRGAPPGNRIPALPAAQKVPFEAPVLSKFTNMQEFLLVDPIHEIDYTGWPEKPA